MVRTAEPTADAVAVVASAGGVTAIGQLLGGLPSDLAVPVVVVLHLPPEHRSLLSQILARRTAMRVKEAQDGDVLEDGCVYVAPADAHLLFEPGGRLALDAGPPVHFLRPNANRLLESLAHEFGGHCLAIVLTGTGSDGAEGALAVKAAGGTVLAQDEASSEHFGMPGAAIAAGAVDRVLPLGDIASAVVDFAASR